MAKSIVLRFNPESLHKELKAEAEELPGKVSLNTYIVTLLTTHPDRVRRKKGGK